MTPDAARGGAALSHASGTFEATAVTTRQWIGVWLAIAALLVTSAFVGGSTGALASDDRSGTIELMVRISAWSYAVDFRGEPIAYTFPPVIPLSLGFVTILLSASTLAVDSHWAIIRARGKWLGLRFSYGDPLRNLKRQLRERGGTHLFSRRGVYLRLGLALAGAGLVVLTALFPLIVPTSITASGQTFHDVKMGWLPTVCLVGGVIILIGLLLAFPFGPRETVVIDGAGNVRGTDEPVGPPVTGASGTHFCTQCGSPAAEGARFCISCGAALAPSGSPAPA